MQWLIVFSMKKPRLLRVARMRAGLAKGYIYCRRVVRRPDYSGSMMTWTVLASLRNSRMKETMSSGVCRSTMAL